MASILVIDDERVLREEIIDILTMEAFEAIEAFDGVEGVRLAALHAPDLIVCDVLMPRLDGFGVLRELRSNALTRHIPFIFLSAMADIENVTAGLRMGADDFLTKPFTAAQLVSTIRRLLASAPPGSDA